MHGIRYYSNFGSVRTDNLHKYYLTRSVFPDGDKVQSHDHHQSHVYNYTNTITIYTRALMCRGLGERVRTDAVRGNDGKRMLRHWRYDLLEFYK